MELWERVKTIYMASQQTEEQKSQVDRYLSMVTKVERDGDSFTMFTTNSAAAELLNTAYAEKIASLMSLFFGISGAKVKFTLDEARKAAIIIPPEEKRAAAPDRQRYTWSPAPETGPHRGSRCIWADGKNPTSDRESFH